MSHSIIRHKVRDLQRLHEANYCLLMKLVPCLHDITEAAVSIAYKSADLYLQIHEHTPYTTVLSLTHKLSVGESIIPVPDLWLRVYHDARVAEAIAQRDGVGPAHSRDYPLQLGLDADIKWTLNHFMEKWLRYCLIAGHRFTEDSLLESGIEVTR